MLKLPNVSLVALTNKNFEDHKKAIDKSCEAIEFGDVKIIWDEKCTSIDEWNRKIIYELHNYIFTDYTLLVHADGYVVNPEAWREDFLHYDYIGAPWPLPTDDYSYRTPGGEIIRVGNSVSIRSKKLMELIATREWKSYFGNTNEDGFICVHHRDWLQSQGMKFAPLDVAKYFSKECEIPENKELKPFAFHTYFKPYIK